MRKPKAGSRPESATACRVLTIAARAPFATRGIVRVDGLVLPCALGRTGRRFRKREGDGATPIGRFSICEVFYRSDRVRRPRTALPCRPLRPWDGWCDTMEDRNYNRLVKHPYPASAEVMWREDSLYDVVLVLGYNRQPRVRGRGSAIFMHLARPGYAPTAGCVALSARNMRIVLERLAPGAMVRVVA
ncbi:MAG: L,D-transpeptidase family protein [Hyphomicrobiaceae bacterium]